MQGGHKVFLGCLPGDASTDELKEVLLQFSCVENVKLLQHRNPGGNKYCPGYGFAYCKNQLEMSKLLQVEEPILYRGRQIVIKEHSSGQSLKTMRNNLDRRRLFVGDIPLLTDLKTLKQLFEQFGPVETCHVVDQSYSREYLYGFIVFEREEHAEVALNSANRLQVRGYTLRVEKCLGSKNSRRNRGHKAAKDKTSSGGQSQNQGTLTLSPEVSPQSRNSKKGTGSDFGAKKSSLSKLNLMRSQDTEVKNMNQGGSQPTEMTQKSSHHQKIDAISNPSEELKKILKNKISRNHTNFNQNHLNKPLAFVKSAETFDFEKYENEYHEEKPHSQNPDRNHLRDSKNKRKNACLNQVQFDSEPSANFQGIVKNFRPCKEVAREKRATNSHLSSFERENPSIFIQQPNMQFSEAGESSLRENWSKKKSQGPVLSSFSSSIADEIIVISRARGQEPKKMVLNRSNFLTESSKEVNNNHQELNLRYCVAQKRNSKAFSKEISSPLRTSLQFQHPKQGTNQRF